MNKKLFAKVYQELSKEKITIETALKDVEDFLEILEKALLVSMEVKLVKKGVFEVVKKRARRISNPQTREIMEIYPRKNVRLRVSKYINFS